MNPIAKTQEQLGEVIIKNLKKRHMDGFYCKTPEEAVELVLSMIPADSTVSWGGTMTMKEIGLANALAERDDITCIDRSQGKTVDDIEKIYRDVFSCDSYIMSTNAITRDGELVNIDGNGNRVAALIFGPKQVFVIAGMNKVCKNLEEAMNRSRDIAAPPNCVRLHKETPCATTGFCHDCLSPDCICNQIVITRNSRDEKRIKVILIEGSWGY